MSATRKHPGGEVPAPYALEELVDRTFHGDCVELLGRFPRGAYDTAFIDPPFNIAYSYDEYDDNRPRDEYLAWCRTWLDLCRNVLRPEGTLWLAIGPKYYPDVDVIARAAGFHRRSCVVWHYTFGINNKKNFSLGYTNLVYYTRHREKFHFDVDACRVPSARQLVYGDKRANPKGKLPDDVWFYRPQDLPEGLSGAGDLWHCPRVAGTFRSRQDVPTHMPEQVVARCLQIVTPVGGLVLDPMVGAGTTPAVCKKLGFRYTAIELSEDYCAKSEARLSRVKFGDPLDIPDIQGDVAPEK